MDETRECRHETILKSDTPIQTRSDRMGSSAKEGDERKHQLFRYDLTLCVQV